MKSLFLIGSLFLASSIVSAQGANVISLNSAEVTIDGTNVSSAVVFSKDWFDQEVEVNYKFKTQKPEAVENVSLYVEMYIKVKSPDANGLFSEKGEAHWVFVRTIGKLDFPAITGAREVARTLDDMAINQIGDIASDHKIEGIGLRVIVMAKDLQEDMSDNVKFFTWDYRN